jgi:hypothetical protein
MRVSQPWENGKKKSWTTSAGPCLHRTFVVWRRHTAAAEHFKLTLAFNHFDSNCMTLPANSWPFIPEKIWVEIDIFLYSGCCLVLRRIKKLARNSIENDREK